MSIRLEALEARRLFTASLFPIGLGSTGQDTGDSVAADRSGNVYVAGTFSGTVDFDPGAGTAQLAGGGGFVAKYASDGAFVWARQFIGAAPAKVATDRAGNVYFAGTFAGTVDFDPRRTNFAITSGGGTDAFVCKLNTHGNLALVRTFGGAADDTGDGLAVDTRGNMFIGGTFLARADFNKLGGGFTIGNSGGADGYMVALDSAGAFRWAGSFTGGSDQKLADMALDGGGNILASGRYGGTVDFDPRKKGTANAVASTDQGFTVKWDNNGAFVWIAGFGGASTTFATSVAADRDGNVYTTGNFQNTADFDPRGGTVNLVAAATGAVFISKLNAAGNFVWAKAIGGSTDVEVGPGEISVDKFENIYTTGQYTGTQDFDPSGGVSNLSSAGLNDVFVSKLDSSGARVYAKTMGGPAEDRAPGSALGFENEILITGRFAGTSNFATSGSPLNLTSNGLDDVFISKLDETTGAPA